MSKSGFEAQDDEIDLLELIKVLWEQKLRILIITAIASFISLIYAISLPNVYYSEALLAPANDEGGSRMSSISSQFGGIASLAGISLPDEGNDMKSLALEVLKSRKFVREFVARHKITPQLMAVKRWDKGTRKLELDTSIYDPKSKTWVAGDGPPSQETIYRAYMDALIIEEDTASDFVRVGVKHASPDIAAEWTGLIIRDLNDAIRKQHIDEAESSIAYLRKQVEATPLTDLRKLFFNLIQSRTETMMLANVREEYVFKTIDPAIVPELKSEPKRMLILVLGSFLGGFLALIYVLGRHYIRPLNS